jgi:hypothetical protein
MRLSSALLCSTYFIGVCDLLVLFVRRLVDLLVLFVRRLLYSQRIEALSLHENKMISLFAII